MPNLFDSSVHDLKKIQPSATIHEHEDGILFRVLEKYKVGSSFRRRLKEYKVRWEDFEKNQQLKGDSQCRIRNGKGHFLELIPMDKTAADIMRPAIIRLCNR